MEMERIINLRNELKYQEAYDLLKEEKCRDPWYYSELITISYYLGLLDEGRKAINHVLLKPSDEMATIHAQFNQRWYLFTLNGKRIDFSREAVGKLSFESEVDNHVQVCYFASNPSIVKTETGYLVNIRFVNYLIVNNAYISTSKNDIIKTENLCLELNKNFEELRSVVLNDGTRIKYQSRISGIEDIRLAPGSTYESSVFTGTVCDYSHDYNAVPKIIKGKIQNGIVTDCFLPAIPDPKRCEKNWAPIEGDNRYVYGFTNYPSKLLLIEPDHEEVKLTEVEQLYELDMSWFRGSSQLIKYKDGYLSIIHHISFDRTANHPLRRYIHRFVRWNDKLQVTHISHGFKFYDELIQFVAGICLTHNLKHVVISLSVRDRTAHLLKVSTAKVESLLCELSNDI